jgi:hypothetical protein
MGDGKCGMREREMKNAPLIGIPHFLFHISHFAFRIRAFRIHLARFSFFFSP